VPGVVVSEGDRERRENDEEERRLHERIRRVVEAAAGLGAEAHTKTAIANVLHMKRTDAFGAIEVAASSAHGYLEAVGKDKPKYRVTSAGRRLVSAPGEGENTS
jgi:CubicO group peptidase (beta-lactamase class C family)